MPNDDPVDSSNGSTKKQQEDIDSLASGAMEDDLTLADADQTRAEGDQTGSDSDQTAADSDQAAADSDQAAADSDQAASDRDLAHGGDQGVHDATRELRDRSTQKRRHANQKRIEAAAARDAVANARDQAAEARDQAASLLDEELEARDAAQRDRESNAELTRRTVANRERAAADRAAAAQGRARAAVDRKQAKRDREQAARDRRQAQEDRDALLVQLAVSEIDMLTGARARAPGLADLDLEIDRARRTTNQLVIAYVDVVGLKAVNDTQGHSAGDALLVDVVQAIRRHLRSYDSIVRVGGDEFVCVLSGSLIEDVRQRFDAIQSALASTPGGGRIKVGFAALASEESATELIDRADADLPVSPN